MGNVKQKLLVICGPTSTGKTRLALHLARKFNGELVSADSRQVYKYMDIGTGKDVKDILGYDLVSPNEKFSVSEYLKFATDTIKKINGDKKLPILVGGTGFYVKAVVDGVATADIGPNEILRENLKDKTVEELFKILSNTDNKKATSMNESDRMNPRRLIRAIEVAGKIASTNFPEYDVLFIGLTEDLDKLKIRISRRVEERIKEGFEKEVKFLKQKGFWNGAPSMTLGYKDWPDIEKWKTEEFKYAKRQMTWFKKDKRIKWFDIEKENYQSQVEEWTQKWYSSSINA